MFHFDLRKFSKMRLFHKFLCVLPVQPASLFICWFNFQGILSFRIQSGNLAISKLISFVNFILYPALTLVQRHISRSTIAENMNSGIYQDFFVSVFTVTLSASLSIFSSFLTVCVIYIQLWKQKKVLVLILNCVEAFKFFQISINKESFDEFIKKCWTTVGISLIIGVALNFANYYVFLKLSWTSLLLHVVSCWHTNSVIHLIAFVSLFLNYFVTLMKNFRSKLKHVEKNSKNYEKLVLEYSNIYKLVTEFNKLFGLLLSLSTTFLISSSTVLVRLLDFQDSFSFS